MAEIDSLDIKISASAKNANNAINKLIQNIGKLSTSLNFDTGSLEKIANIKGLENISKSARNVENQLKTIVDSTGKILSNVDSSSKSSSKSIESINNTAKRVSKSLSQITEQYKELGKGYTIKGNAAQIQKEIDKISNAYAKAKLKKDDLETSGKAKNKQYENAVKDTIKWSNAIESLKNQLEGIDNTQVAVELKINGSEYVEKSIIEFEKELLDFKHDIESIKNAYGDFTNVPVGNLNIPIQNLSASLQDLENTYPNATELISAFETELKRVQEISANLTRQPATPSIDISSISTKSTEVSQKLIELSKKLNQIAIPPIREENLDKLQANLQKTTIKLDELRAKLENGLTMGDISESTDDSGFVKLQEQIAYTEKYAEALKEKISELSGANGEAGESSEKLGKNLSAIKTGANSAASSVSNLTKKAKSFTRQLLSAIGVVGGLSSVIKGIKNSISSFADYAESYNYFEVAFGKVASEWSDSFSQYGYDNAESYAESFTERMNDTLGKLSGVQVNFDTGLLEDTGLKNLGLNIQEITQYASQLASVTNSIGQMGEASLATAKSMTMLAGDVSSLFNVDYSTVAKDIQSVLMGQSRAGYKYGWDTTTATLQNFAENFNLSKPVSEMTQAEKQQLRLLAVLEQSKVSWGDLANTISSPSNMMRQFSANVKEAGLVLGQIFMPTLQKVMPVVNGVTIAVKRLLTSIAGLMGIEIDFSDFKQSTNDITDGIDDITDGYEDAADAVKEWQNQLLGFDEMNVLNAANASDATVSAPSIDLTSDILDAVSDYEKVWNDAFANMENAAQKWADKFEKYLEPIKNIFEDIKLGDFFKLGEDVGGMAMSIYNWVTEAVESVDWSKVGKNIASFLNGALKKINGKDIAKGINALSKMMWDSIISFVKEFDFAEFGKTLGEFISNIDWGSIVWDFAKLVSSLISGIAKAIVSFWKAAPIEAALITSFAVLKISGAGAKLWDSVKGGFDDALTSAGGFGQILTTDLSTVMSTGSVVQKATTIGTGIAGVIGAAFAGWQIGTAISDSILETMIKPYKERMEFLNKDRVTEETKQLVTDVTNAVEEILSNSEQRLQKFGDIEVDYKLLEDLADKYFDLAQKEELTAEEEEKLKMYHDLLVEDYPELAEILDDNETSYKDQAAAVDKYIQSLKKKAYAEAAQEYLKESYKDLIEAEKEYADLGENTAKKQQEWYDAAARYKENLRNMTELEKQYDEAAAEGRKKEAEALADAWEEANNQLLSLQDAELQARQEYYATKDAYDAMGGALNQLGDDVAYYEQQYIKAIGGIEETTQKSSENIEEDVEKTSNTIGEMGQAASDAQEQVDNAMAGMENEVKTNQARIRKQIADTRKSMGEMSDDLPKAKESASTTIDEIVKLFQDNFSSSQFEGYGKNILQGTINGLKNSSLWQTASNIMSGFANGLKNWFTKPVEINSPSKVFEKFGGFLPEGLNIGLLKNIGSTEKIMNEWAGMIADYKFNPVYPVEMQFDYSAQTPNLSTNATQEIILDITAQVRQASYEGVSAAFRENGGISVEFEPNEIGIFKVTQKGAKNYVAQTGLSPFPV